MKPKKTAKRKAAATNGKVLTMPSRRRAASPETHDERYAINAAKTEWREGYNTGDVERVLALFADEFTDLSDGRASFYRNDAKPVLRARLAKLFRENYVTMAPVILDISVAGPVALEYGWHSITLRPKARGAATTRRTRYVQLWRRDDRGEWKIFVFIDNADHAPQLAEDVIRAFENDAHVSGGR